MANGIEDLREIASGIFAVDNRPLASELRHEIAKLIGRKGAGLSLIPSNWTPPFIAISASVFSRWRSLPIVEAESYLLGVAEDVARLARDWANDWKRGIFLRSSATEETLNERGTYNSLPLTADFDGAMISRSIGQIFRDFLDRDGDGEMAIVVQARAACVASGHISNEQRVSKTINQWTLEYEKPDAQAYRFNSQRDFPPDLARKIEVSRVGISQLRKLFRKIGRWCTALNIGRTHLEWGLVDGALWIFQFDLEADQPDEGINPNDLKREGDFSPVGEIALGSPFAVADLTTKTGWKKIDKVAALQDPNERPYPRLIFITGTHFLSAQSSGYDLKGDLESFASGRIVCRTDCISENIGPLNLPRTDTVGSDEALAFMENTIKRLAQQGAEPGEICFILHKFIPSITAAWAVARLGEPIVRVDSLWGLPDGLQYLPHDSFEYDVSRSAQSTERVHYKPAFLQENCSGVWEVSRISRHYARTRSLPAADLAYVAEHTHAVAKALGKDIQIMWFCRVPDGTGLPANIPWFAMTPHAAIKKDGQLSPPKRRHIVRSIADLEEAERLPRGQAMLQVDPDDPELFRSNEFLDRVKEVATRNDFPVGLTGSILGHAFYVLEKAGLSVIAFNEPTRVRVRHRQVFHKIVRDDIPKRISEGGETVTLAEIAMEEARAALVGKMFEESFELLGADAPDDVAAELADMLEVVQSLANSTGVDWQEVLGVAADKRSKRGGFEKNLVLLETASPGWLKNQPQSPSIRIPLRDLNRVTRKQNTVTVPFSALLGNDLSTTVQLADGSFVRLALGPQGFSISPVDGERDDGQMSFLD